MLHVFCGYFFKIKEGTYKRLTFLTGENAAKIFFFPKPLYVTPALERKCKEYFLCYKDNFKLSDYIQNVYQSIQNVAMAPALHGYNLNFYFISSFIF